MQIRPRPNLAMKLIASGVIFSAAMVRSPSFSRSSSSTTMIIRPWRNAATASSMDANGDFGRRGCAISAPGQLERTGDVLADDVALEIDYISRLGDAEVGFIPGERDH